MIETDATNVIWKRKSKKRRRNKRKCRRKSCEWEFWLQKWKFCWKSWLQRNVEKVWLFVWRQNRFFWQDRNRTNRFRERMLLKTFRIRVFQILTNRCFLIDCKQKINDDVKLINSKLTNVKFLRRKSTILILLQIKWFEFFNKHAMKIMNCKMKFRNRFSKSWCRCRDRRNWWCNFHRFWYDFECKYRKTWRFWWCNWFSKHWCKYFERNRWRNERCVSRRFENVIDLNIEIFDVVVDEIIDWIVCEILFFSLLKFRLETTLFIFFVVWCWRKCSWNLFFDSKIFSQCLQTTFWQITFWICCNRRINDE